MPEEIGRIIKNNITLVEYDRSESGSNGSHFIQCGVVGMLASDKELRDLYTVLNYYLNIEDISQCQLRIGGEDVAIS